MLSLGLGLGLGLSLGLGLLLALSLGLGLLLALSLGLGLGLAVSLGLGLELGDSEAVGPREPRSLRPRPGTSSSSSRPLTGAAAGSDPVDSEEVMSAVRPMSFELVAAAAIGTS